MTPARRTARTLRTIAAISTTCGLTAGAHQPVYLLPGLTGAAVLLIVAASFDREDQRIHTRHQQLVQAATEDAQTLATPHDARTSLTNACCDMWWTSCGTAHDQTCPATTVRSSAA